MDYQRKQIGGWTFLKGCTFLPMNVKEKPRGSGPLKESEGNEQNYGNEGSEVSGARRSQRRDENREASAGRADHSPSKPKLVAFPLGHIGANIAV
jgi:hypothetical protein